MSHLPTRRTLFSPCVLAAGKTGLEKEQEFIRKCMESLLMASANLEKDAHSSLTSIERGLLMLKTHLEAFRRRYVCFYARSIDVSVQLLVTCHFLRHACQVCLPPAAVADRGDGDQQPPEGVERQTVSAAQDRLPARRPPRQGDIITSDTASHTAARGFCSQI